MHLFQRTLLQGAHDRLVDAGRMLPFANDKIATEVFDKIASDMGLPAILTERPNSKQAAALGNALIDYSQKLAASGYGPDQELMGLAKQASAKDPSDRALIVAEYYIQKAAEEGSIHESGGTGLRAAGEHDPMARLDLMNRATGAYAVSQGQSNFAMPGVLGRELSAPGAPSTGANVSQKLALDSQMTMEQIRQRSAEAAAAARDASQGSFIPEQFRSLGDNHMSRETSGVHALESMRGGRGAGVLPSQAGILRQVGQELGSTPMQHIRAWDDRSGWGKARSAGALGAQALGAGAALYGAARGAQALYRHFVPEEKQVQASEKVALDMPDFGKAWASIKSRASDLRTGASNVGNQMGNAARVVGTDPRTLYSGTRDAMEGISALKGMEGLSGHGDELAALVQRRNAGLAGMGAQAGLGLAAAGGLAYGGKKLYDHLQGSPEDMEVNASDDSLGALAQALQEHGIEPTADLLAELHEAMEEEASGGGGGSETPPGAPSGQEPPKQAAEGSLHPTPPGNKLTGAAAHDPIAALDVKNRAPGSYKVPQGKTELSTASGTVGDEKPAPEKNASENAWRENIVKTAQEWGPYLPAAWPENVKHAAIQNIAAQAPSDRPRFVQSLLRR